MKVPDTFIKVSKESILKKVFNADESKFTPEEKQAFEPFRPTPDEIEFMKIYNMDAPQLVRLQRKMSVCLDVEVTELEDEKISFIFGEDTYTVLSPKNTFRICTALEKGKMDGFLELSLQGCLLKNGKELEDVRKEKVLAVDEMQILSSVADKFFFQTFLGS